MMDGYLRQSTEVTVKIGPFLDATDAVTPESGLAGNATEISKAGGAYAAGPTLGTHDEDGEYPITLTTAHTDTLGILKVKSFDAATHRPVWHTFQVVSADVYDSLFAGSFEQLVDDIWDEALTGATHNEPTSAGRRLRQLGAVSIRSGTAQAGAENSITLDSGASATDEIYDSNLVVITAGTGIGQSRVIVEYDGTTKVAIVDRVWETNPDNTSEFQVIASHQADITHHGLAQAGSASTVTLAATASSQNDIYNGQTIFLRTSTGTGQARLITDYNGTTKVATVAPDWQVNPASDTVYAILPVGSVIVESAAAGALIKANVTQINDVALGGTGTTGDEWGPA